MNKLALSLVLVAMFVGMASASFFKGKGGHKTHEEEYEPEHEHHHKLGHHGGKHGKHYNHGGDDEEYNHGHHHNKHHYDDDCEYYGTCGHHEYGHGHGVHHHGGHQGGYKHGGYKGANKHGHQHQHHHSSKARAVSGHGVGAIGGAGFHNQKEFDAGVHSNKHLGSHKSAQGHKAFVAGKNKKFQAGKNRHDLHDAEGHNRHSGFNKDKLIVKEHEDGFKGDTGFHNHDEHSDSAHIGASEGKFIAGKKGGKIVSNKDFDSEHDANIHAASETDAGFVGAKGAGLVDFE